MKISVITPVLNGATFIRETVESVLSQTGDFELEYIIKDGGSTDETLAILEGYQDHPSVTIVSKKDSSLYDAINQGFELASGDIGCWLNADDSFAPHSLETIAQAFQKKPHRQWLYGYCDIVDEAGTEIRRPITWYKQLLGWRYSTYILLCENYVNQPATFWKMDLWRQVGGLCTDYRIAADYHLWIKFAQVSPAITVHRTLAHFRRCGESISDTQFEEQFREELCVAKDYAQPLTYSIHRFNRWKIVTAYKLLS